MLDSVGLVHMNGRVYDPTIGRFLSADPIIQTIQLSQAINPFSYVMNMPLMLTDPSGYSWFKKLFHSIGHFLKKFWRPILAIAVAAITWGYAAPFFSQLFSATTLATGTITTIGGMVGGALAGAAAGAITGGFRGALLGMVSGAMFGGIQGFYGQSFNLGRMLASGVAGGVTAEVAGGNFGNGAALGLAMFAAQWAATSMRVDMVKQSMKEPLNASGQSRGWMGDFFKLGGGRVTQVWVDGNSALPPGPGSPLGGFQGGVGRIAALGRYAAGSWRDLLVEGYAGPHDWFSQWWYNSAGNFISVPNRLVNVLFWTHSTLNLIPATAVLGSQVAPSLAFEGKE
jgi:RHS repeat-associated protein